MDKSEILELAQHKLIVLYIIKGANHLFSDEELSKFILENDLMNYFFLQQYIKELIDANLLSSDSSKNYYITKDGISALNLFKYKIPEDIINLLETEIKNFKKDKVYEQSVNSNYFIDDYGRFYVDLSLSENGNLIFSLNFEVPTEEYAIAICKNFKEYPEDIYLKTINLFNIK